MKQNYFFLLFLGMVIILPFQYLSAQVQTFQPEKIIKPVHFDVSKKLRDIEPVPPGTRPRSWKDNVIKNMTGMYQEFEEGEQWTGPDPVLQDEISGSRSGATVNENFAGLGNLNNVAPPDTDGDVGPNHYFQMINLSFAIYNKDGTILYGPADNITLWDGFDGPWSSTNDGDPIVLYDQYADRWIATQFSFPNYPSGPFYELIAVSQTGDPTGAWNRYAYSFDNLPDYPKFGIWPDGYYMSINQFAPPSLYFAGAGVSIFDRDAMIAGDANPTMVFFSLSSYASLLPADADGTSQPPANSPNYFINLGSNSLRIFEADVDWDNTSNSSVTLVNTLTTQPFSNSGIVIDQPGTNEGLDDLADRLMFRVQYRNFGSHQTMVTNHSVNADGNGRAGVRWYELRNTGGAWSIYQQGTYAPADGDGRWMGSVAMNSNGDIAVGYSVSGASTYPSIRVAGRTSGATIDPGLLDVDETSILEGSNSQTGVNRERWGDYSMMSVDPVDDNTFWYTTEYTTGGWNWKTQIASFNFAPPVVVEPIAEFSGTPTSVMEGQTVTFNDESLNNPTSWSWSFPGGTPENSEEQNPVVTYNSFGTYGVSLTATNDEGSNTLEKQNYIDVTEFILTYCESSSTDFSNEYISNVNFGNINNSSGGSFYSDFTDQIIEAEPGNSYNISITPTKSNKNRREYFRVWIDYNINGDFTDAGELVFSADRQRNAVSGLITIPSNASGMTRMRVSMKYNAVPGPCETFTYGEVEDYTINFSEPVPQPPVADFTADKTTVLIGNSVNFTDQSTNNPTDWSWSFEGGTPLTSTVQNPAVSYNTLGTYDVTLTATNNEGSDILTKAGFITVVNEMTAYCASQSTSNALDWIEQVDIGGFSNPSGASTYSDFTSQTISLTPGSQVSVLLTPHFVDKAQREFWRIWIDYNNDGDFEGTGEQVFVANNKKFVISGNFTVPSGLTGQTRMRITMKNGGSPSPCGTFTYGEVEDYTVDFGGASKPVAQGSGIPDDEIILSPNPNNGQFKLTFKEQLIPGSEVRIIDMSGKLVHKYYLTINTIDIDLNDIGRGIYQVIVLNGKNQYNSRVVVN